MEPSVQNSDRKGERIAKALARAGVGSRREVERMIAAGRIAVNGRTLDGPAFLVESLEGVTVDGHAVEAADRTRIWRYFKPDGLITSHRDPQGRATVFDQLPGHLPRVVSVGRLDLNSEGLLLLTNDGALARWLELPKNGWVRQYRVRAYGRVTDEQLSDLANGATIDGVHYGPIEARVERSQNSNVWLRVALTEGKNREVRRVLDHLGLRVNRLIRVGFGPFSLGTLRPGQTIEVPQKQMIDALSSYFDKSAQRSVVAPPPPKPQAWARPKKRRKKPGATRRRTNPGPGKPAN